ncbi:Clp protease/crotonase-like domain-containing protein [Flavilitoribacter nigricans]|uniref:Serine dehydrogenase proteinase n=1 Tax=Flavilitoribacter nigricans (strain ATCC 23147 / DSM 23189 / NBRC 102662 / NCIMB 1420 / SS-2) TaxID=1122177 RepID=A0A2D0NJ28_FLAN2|nr:hypothetical protein [Flavilitoribacter nigricans]PHN08448.1 hypothetical protein CRP01_00615 [Flavilitoribacter nigricans DSM 23189 = NBRC 102662]
MKWFERSLKESENGTSEIRLLEPPVLYEQTQKIIRKIEDFYQSDFIAYWGSNSSSMSTSDVIVLNEILKKKKQNGQLFLFVKSPGGSGKVALRMIHLLRSFYKRIVVLAPVECASAATMLALGADVIKMGPLSYLTAIDTSVTHDLSPVDADDDLVSVSQNELDRVLKLWNVERREKEQNPYKDLYKYIHPLVFGAVDRASSLSIKLTNEILGYHMEDEEKINSISNHLNAEYPAHGYPITAREAAALGLNIETLEEEIHEHLIELNNLYSEMAQRAYTDYDEYRYHDNQIMAILESEDRQIFYQRNKDMIWRKEDKQWISANDQSSWIKVEKDQKRPFYIR